MPISVIVKMSRSAAGWHSRNRLLATDRVHAPLRSREASTQTYAILPSPSIGFTCNKSAVGNCFDWMLRHFVTGDEILRHAEPTSCGRYTAFRRWLFEPLLFAVAAKSKLYFRVSKSAMVRVRRMAPRHLQGGRAGHRLPYFLCHAVGFNQHFGGRDDQRPPRLHCRFDFRPKHGLSGDGQVGSSRA